MKVSLGIVLYKGEKYLGECITSLLNQSYINFELLLRDQGPHHEALAFLETNFPEILEDPRVKNFRGENLWHSGGHNALIDEMTGEAYVCASNDMLYEESFLETLLEAVENFPEYSVFVPKLKKWDFDNSDSQLRKTNFLDSCGISLQKKHHFFDRGQGEKDENQYLTGEIFGASGALFLIQKSALLSLPSPLFDEAIHYKNDIDLAYRLQWAGNKSLFVADSLAYHDRQVGEKNERQNVFQKFTDFWKNQDAKPLWVKESSFYGQLVLLYKNFWRRDFPLNIRVQVFFSLVFSSIFLLITSPSVLLQYRKFCQNISEIRKKRDEMKRVKTASDILRFCS